jgi:hypothetical protein
MLAEAAGACHRLPRLPPYLGYPLSFLPARLDQRFEIGGRCRCAVPGMALGFARGSFLPPRFVPVKRSPRPASWNSAFLLQMFAAVCRKKKRHVRRNDAPLAAVVLCMPASAGTARYHEEEPRQEGRQTDGCKSSDGRAKQVLELQFDGRKSRRAH